MLFPDFRLTSAEKDNSRIHRLSEPAPWRSGPALQSTWHHIE
jgi:hypothetical protein